jgi:gliding motility-associated-like protein
MSYRHTILLLFLFFLFSKPFYSQKDSVTYFFLFKKDYDCTPGAAALRIDSGKPPYTITWSNGQQQVTSVNGLNPGTYSVTIINGNNKDTTVVFKIEKVICPVVPERYFSPNGDNYRDTWIIHNLEFYQDFELFVFNKWGQQVHHQAGGTYQPWDGKYQGVPVVDATYYYILYLEKNKKETILKGDVTIIK